MHIRSGSRSQTAQSLGRWLVAWLFPQDQRIRSGSLSPTTPETLSQNHDFIGCTTVVVTSPRRLARGSALFHLTSYRIRPDQPMYLLTSPAASPACWGLLSGSSYIGGFLSSSLLLCILTMIGEAAVDETAARLTAANHSAGCRK